MRMLNEKEEQVMHVLWRLKKAFVRDILEELDHPRPPYNTVSSIVRKLEAEHMIDHEAFGKTHRYFATLSKLQYRKFRFGEMIHQYFADSPEQLLHYFVKESNVDPDELHQIIEKIKTSEV